MSLSHSAQRNWWNVNITWRHMNIHLKSCTGVSWGQTDFTQTSSFNLYKYFILIWNQYNLLILIWKTQHATINHWIHFNLLSFYTHSHILCVNKQRNASCIAKIAKTERWYIYIYIYHTIRWINGSSQKWCTEGTFGQYLLLMILQV